MVKEIERVGLPAVQICAIVPIALTVGANRIVRAVAIPHPTGDPKLEKGEEIELRKKLLRTALMGLSSKIQEQTVFKSEDLPTETNR
jgi:glycine reductase complex component B subunit gamma